MSKAAKRERQRLNREARREYEQTIARRRRTMKTGRVAVPAVLLVVAVGAYFSLNKSDEKSVAAAAGCRQVAAPKPKDTTFPAAPPLTINPFATYVAHVDTSCGSFAITLAASQAPQTANSFVYLAQQGFYDGLGFHRIVKNFVVQGGDPKGDGTGGPGYTLPDEPPADGYLVGSVAMANAGAGTTGSQFYIVTTEKGAAALNSQKTPEGKFSYSILGQVTEGFETIKRVDKLGTKSEAGKPKADVRILKVTIEQIDPNATTTTPSTPPPS